MTAELNRLARRATIHCLTGCGIGEVLGMVIGTALHWSNTRTMVVAIVLAFLFGYSMTVVPLLRAGFPPGRAASLALAADTASIVLMELIDNGIMLVIPGAMDAHIDSGLFWSSLAGSLAIAGLAAYPLNRWLISRGKGHALVHESAGHDHHGHTH